MGNFQSLCSIFCFLHSSGFFLFNGSLVYHTRAPLFTLFPGPLESSPLFFITCHGLDMVCSCKDSCLEAWCPMSQRWKLIKPLAGGPPRLRLAHERPNEGTHSDFEERLKSQQEWTSSRENQTVMNEKSKTVISSPLPLAFFLSTWLSYTLPPWSPY